MICLFCLLIYEVVVTKVESVFFLIFQIERREKETEVCAICVLLSLDQAYLDIHNYRSKKIFVETV